MIRIAVIGIGVMGSNHARVANELAGAELVAVADVVEERARQGARLYNVPAYTDHKVLLKKERPDAVIVATPTQAHYQVTLDALEAGCHVLVEKPIASTLNEAEAMIKAAQAAHRILMVGHIERFNPAVIELKRRLRAGELGGVFQILARRLGPFPLQILDVGVAVDLATHDIDIMCYLLGDRITSVFAETRRQVHASHEDLLSGIMRFKSGILGVLEVNWLTPTKIRELYLTGERGMFVLNYLTQDLYFYENATTDTMEWGALSVLRGVSEGAMIRHVIRKKEPLRAEQEAFLVAVLGEQDEQEQLASGAESLYALKIALALAKSGQEGRVIEID